MKVTRFVLLLAVAAAPALSAKLAAGDVFSLGPEEQLLSDVYFAGSALRLDGRLDGSVVAACQNADLRGSITHNGWLAGQQVMVSGTVTGDLLAFGATVSVTGAVGGAVRAGCGTLRIDGTVGRDVVAGCQRLTIGPNAEVTGDVIAGCGTLRIDGTIRGDIRASAGEIVIAGMVDGDVDLQVGERLVLTDSGRVFGNLRYHADRELDIGNRDGVFGDVQYVRKAEPERLRVTRPGPGLLAAIFLPLTLYSLLAALAVGFVLVAIWKKQLDEAVATCSRRFGYTIGFGALGFFATPVALVLAMMLVVTIPAALVTGAGYLIAVYLAKTLSGMFLGRMLFRLFRSPNVSLWAAAPVGIVVVYAFCAIPVAGWLIWLFCQLLGFGMLVELIAQTRRRSSLF